MPAFRNVGNCEISTSFFRFFFLFFLIQKKNCFVFRNYFRDPGKLYNPKAIQDILNKWSSELSSIATEFQEECFKHLDENVVSHMSNKLLAFIRVESNSLLFTQLSAGFSEIANAAMLCLEARIYPVQCSKLRSHEIGLLNCDLTYHDIYVQATNEIKRIQSLPKISVTSENKLETVTDIGQASVAVDESKEKHSEENNQINEVTVPGIAVPSAESTPIPDVANDSKTSFVFRNDKMIEDIESKDINDLLYDRHSLSTIVSESGTIVSAGEMIFGCEDHVLKEYPLLCENFNTDDDTCDACIIDKCRACFVLRYFPVLNFSRIRSLLSSNGGCRWRTWTACMMHLKCKFFLCGRFCWIMIQYLSGKPKKNQLYI